MKALFQLYASTALLCFGALLISQESIAATTEVCGSVSMTLLTPTDSTAGTITCEAYGDGNIALDGSGGFNLSPDTQSWTGTLPTYDTVIDPGVSFNTSTGEFSVASSIWDAWESIYVGIKQASGSAGGGWALFELTAIVASGDYQTKLGCTNVVTCDYTGISHAFTLGGDPKVPGPGPGPVPVPAAVWLFGSGLLGLIGLRRRGGSLAA